MIILFILLPGQALDAAFISDRLPIVIVLIGIASTNSKGIKREHATFLGALVLSMTIARASSTTMNWMESSRYYLRLTEAAEKVERGSSVMILSPMTKVRNRGVGFWHNTRMTSPDWHFSLLNIPNLHSYAVIPLTKRAAFSQLHFVWADKQVLSLTAPYHDLDYGDGGNSTWDPAILTDKFQTDEPAQANLDRFDYFLIVYADRLPPKLRREIVSRSPVYRDEDVILLKASPHSP